MKEIALNNSDKRVIVDDDMYDKIMSYSTVWSLSGNYANATRTENGGFIIMHHLVLPCNHPFQVDHIDRNPLNNQRHNLRYLTPSQNGANREKIKSAVYSKYKGVSYDKVRSKWVAIIMKDRKTVFGGRFNTEIEAAKKANELYLKHYGECALLNKIELCIPTP